MQTLSTGGTAAPYSGGGRLHTAGKTEQLKLQDYSEYVSALRGTICGALLTAAAEK